MKFVFNPLTGKFDLINSVDISGKEDVSNKSTNIDTDKASNTKYPSVKAVYDWATGLFATIASLVNSKKGGIGGSINGGGSAITTGHHERVYVGYAGTVTDWKIESYDEADDSALSGSIVIDLKSESTGSSIIGTGNKPTLSSQSSNSANVSGWTSTAITPGWYSVYVVSNTTCKKVSFSINLTKS